jgi:transcriptional regulator with XRE-family HTH domain
MENAVAEDFRRTVELVAKIRDIKTEMKRKGWSPSRLAEEAFISPATVLRLFRGRTRRPSYFTIEACCHALNMKLEIEPVESYVQRAQI